MGTQHFNLAATESIVQLFFSLCSANLEVTVKDSIVARFGVIGCFGSLLAFTRGSSARAVAPLAAVATLAILTSVATAEKPKSVSFVPEYKVRLSARKEPARLLPEGEFNLPGKKLVGIGTLEISESEEAWFRKKKSPTNRLFTEAAKRGADYVALYRDNEVSTHRNEVFRCVERQTYNSQDGSRPCLRSEWGVDEAESFRESRAALFRVVPESEVGDPRIDPFARLLEEGNYSALKTLLASDRRLVRASKRRVFGKAKKKFNALAIAVRAAQPGSVKALLEAGANPQQKTYSNGRKDYNYALDDLLTGAQRWSSREERKPDSPKYQRILRCMEILLEAGVKVNYRNPEDGETPLHQAARSSDPEIVSLLLRYGADKKMATTKGGRKTPVKVVFDRTRNDWVGVRARQTERILRGLADAPDPEKDPRWLAASDAKCKVWNADRGEDAAVSWSGGCSAGGAHGKGVLQWYRNGTPSARYKGIMYEGKRQGFGIFTDASGGRYEGPWLFDNRQGKGLYEWPNGDRYEGLWEQGRQRGEGFSQLANGDSYRGKFMDGKRDGIGECQDALGRKGKCEWAAGKFVRWLD